MRKTFQYLGVLGAALALTACGQADGRLPVDQEPTVAVVPEAKKNVVPETTGMSVAEGDSAIAKAGLIAILRYEPAIVADAGRVVGTDPPAGSLVDPAAVVTVIVAGKPGKTLQEFVNANRYTYVGATVDTSNVMVVGVHRDADLTKEMPKLRELMNGTPFRIQTCTRSYIELSRVVADLSRRDFVPNAERLSFATSIDPLACAVRLTIDLTDEDTAALTAKYAGALVIQRGNVSRTG